MSQQDTIAAIASPPGRAPRAIVRASGPAVPEIVAALFTGAHRFSLDDGRSMPVLHRVGAEPNTFTGEHTLELLIPGSPELARRVLARLTSMPGVRLAEPGEFSARAYLNGRLPLDRAEGVAMTIAATQDSGLDAARALRTGAEGAELARLADTLADALALVEAGIDFTEEEDVVPIAPAALATTVREILSSLDARLSGAVSTERDDAEPRVAIVGPPNAGKSTLFNALLGRPRAITADHAGTTRDVLDEPLDLSADSPGAGVVRLQDLPGLDERPAAGTDALARRAAIDAIHAADVVLHCDPLGAFDAPPGVHPSTPPHPPPQTIRVRTKADLAGDARDDGLAVCAIDGWRLSALRRAIADAAGAPSSALAAAPRRHSALLEASRALGLVLDELAAGFEPERVADPLRAALDALGSLVGEVSADDVLGRVFAGFCVGK